MMICLLTIVELLPQKNSAVTLLASFSQRKKRSKRTTPFRLTALI
jgi:hypothetical protein